MTNSSWKQAIKKEFAQAQTAREAGNEGMARVCARRAAGIAVGKFFTIYNLPDPGPSTIERLKYLHAIPDISPEARQAAKLLTMRVNTHHELPIEADLITEAHKLIISLLPEFQDA
jgi:hypothetical protein